VANLVVDAAFSALIFQSPTIHQSLNIGLVYNFIPRLNAFLSKGFLSEKSSRAKITSL